MTFGSAFSPESVGSFGLFFGLSIDSSIWIIRCPTSSTADQPVLSMVSSPPLDKARHHGFGPCLRFSQISTLDPITIQTIATHAVLDTDPQAVLVGADRDQEGTRVVVIGVAAGVLDLSRPDIGRTFDPFQGAGHARRRWRSRTAAAPECSVGSRRTVASGIARVTACRICSALRRSRTA